MSERRRRWWGDPAEEQQPDVGDVLVYRDERRGRDWYHLVRHATQVRGGGPAGEIPDELASAVLDLETRLFYAKVGRHAPR